MTEQDKLKARLYLAGGLIVLAACVPHASILGASMLAVFAAFIFGVGAIVMLNVAVYYFAWKVFQAVIR